MTLVLCSHHGEVLGQMEPFAVPSPWWQDAREPVEWVQDRHGVRVTLLRLLEAALASPPGGPVTYLAEVDRTDASALPLAAWHGSLQPHPLRLPYAEPGGPAGDLAWADAVLAARGAPRTGPAEQVRTWNLSSLWRLPLAEGSAWMKCVPPFFAHEPAVLELLRDHPVPRLWASESRRLLMREIPGEDLYAAELPTLLRLVSTLVDIQVSLAPRLSALKALGLPDWRAASLTELVDSVVRRNATQLSARDRGSLAGFLDDLPRRFAALAACGLPDTLVHGDFAPGNARGHGDELVLLDWGDCGLGHPMLDVSAFTDRIPADLVDAVTEHWISTWRDASPGADPGRALSLVAPVAAARQAVVYQGFLDRIEPSEHPYHRDDPAAWLTRTAELVRSQGQDQVYAARRGD